MIIFPDLAAAGRRSLPLLTLGVCVGIAVAIGLAAWGADASANRALALVFALACVVAVGGPTEFALGRPVFALALLIASLSAVGLPLVSLDLRPSGSAWVPQAALSLAGITAGLFGGWQLRPLYSLPGLFGRLRYPAFLPVLIGTSTLGALAWYDSGMQRQFLLHFQCAAAGFIIGLAMGALSLVQPTMFTREYTARIIGRGLRQVEDLMRSHKIGKARRLIRRLSSLDPDHLELQRARYAVWKYDPDRPEFHAAAAALLNQPETDAKTNQMVEEIFRDYMAVTQGKPNLPTRMHLNLAQRFATTHNLEDAAVIVNVYLQRNVRHAALPGAILTLAEGYALTERPAKAAHYAETLLALFPVSAEARTAKSLLIRVSRQLE